MVVSNRWRSRGTRLSVPGALVIALIAGSATLLLPAEVAVAATVGSPTTIIGGQSSRCVDVPNGSTTNGTQVQLWDCISSSTAQRWTYTAGNQLQVYGNKCFDANGAATANGTKLILWACNGQQNQRWALRS